MLGLQRLSTIVLAAASLARAHSVITYPGWRGDNLHTTGTPPDQNPDTVGIDFYENGTMAFPYGMQWMYPCTSLEYTPPSTLFPSCTILTKPSPSQAAACP